MAGSRLPGPLGMDFNLRLDSGTMARIASPLPGALHLPNPMMEWLRREAAGAVRTGQHLAAEWARRAVINELVALRNDVDALLERIAALPESVRREVMCEVFSAGFSHYLPKKLIHHYVNGRGAAMQLTLQEMKDCNPYINVQRSAAFRDLVAKSAAQGGKPLPFELSIAAAALTNGTLGQFTVKVKGQVSAPTAAEWSAKGKMSFYDKWDFDPKDFATGGRSVQGELKTRFANSLLPGQGFEITSEETDLAQTQADSSVVWAGGKPALAPDRVAALDMQLGKS